MKQFVGVMALGAIAAFVFVGVSSAQDIVNLLDNNGFEDGIMAPWVTYGQVATEVVDKLKNAEVDEPPIEGKYALRVEVLQKGANFWDSGLQHKGVNVFEKGKVYTLSAFLKAEKGTMQINFKPELAENPWTGYGETQFTFTNTWKEYWITTPPMPQKVNPAQITFHIAFNTGVFWIDAARFYEGEYVPSDVGQSPQAVQPTGKLATVWADLKKL